MEIVLFIAFVLVSARTGRAIHRERAVFREFGQSMVLMFLVPLYPFAFLVVEFGGRWLPGGVAWVVAALCFLPAGLIARRQMGAFQRAGTSRAQPAEAAVATAAGFAMLGLGLLVLGIGFQVAMSFVHGQ